MLLSGLTKIMRTCKGLPAANAPRLLQRLQPGARPLAAGRNEIDLGKGDYVVLGFIPAGFHVTPHINFSARSSTPASLD